MSSQGEHSGSREASQTTHHTHATPNPTSPTLQNTQPSIPPPNLITKPNLPFGDDIHSKIENTYRHIGGNVNGISPKNKFADATELSVQALAFQADGASYIETNINYEKDGAHHHIRNKLKAAWNQHANFIHCSAAIETETPYQPGGVCQVIGGAWTRKTTCSTSDPTGLGQWTYQTIAGADDQKITFITAYQVCPGTAMSGEKTAWKQRQAIMTSQAIDDSIVPNPRQKFTSDLTDLCRSLQAQGHGLILFMDANSTLNDTGSWLHDFLQKTNLHDIYSHRHGYDNEPATHTRGSQRIDFMLTTVDVLPYVASTGYTSFASISDHRTMYCDIHLSQYLKDDPPPDTDTLTPRHILSKYKKMRSLYKKEVLTRLTGQHYQEIIAALATTAEQQKKLTAEDYKRLNEVDRLITNTLVNTESNMRRQHHHPWSPILIRYIKAVQYWKSWISEITTTLDHSKTRADILIHFEDPTSFPSEPPTIEIAKAQFRKCKKMLTTMLKQADRLREEWLLSQEDIARDVGDKVRAKILKNIRKSEATMKSHRKLRQIIHGRTEGKLKSVLIPYIDDTYKRISDPVELIDSLISRNIEHFHQSEGTAFTNKNIQTICAQTFATAIPLLHELTGQGNEAFDAIITELQNTAANTPIVSGTLTGADIMGKMKNWRESTTTSPSGCHLGLYRSLLKGDNPILGTPHPLQQEEEPNHGDIFFDCIAQIINICVHTGYVLPRWKPVTNVMLEKIPGQPIISKLRVIHLFEADFNAWAGIIFARRLMKQAEQLKALGNEQGGSRQGRTCVDVYAMKFFSFQLSEITRTPLAVMDNDAKACYDRIVMALAYLRSQQLGMEHQACTLLENFLSQAQYHIQTQFGISEKHYGTTASKKLHGPGQGSQSSPAIWTLVSTLILSAVRRKSPGTFFTDPQQQTTVAHYMQSFVDDSSIWVNDFLNSLDDQINLDALATTLETATQWWEQLLVATGGKLELQKCFYYVIHWKFNTNGSVQLTHPTDHLFRIEIQQSTDNTRVLLEHKNSHESHRTLGFQTKPGNDYQDQYQILHDKSLKLTRQLRAHNIDSCTARRAYHTVFVPRISYALNLCGLDTRQLAKIQSPALIATLQATGIPKSFPRSIVFANQNQGGLGYSTLYTEQGILNITFILRHLRQQSQIGDTIIIQLRWYQHFAGVSYPLLEEPKPSMKYIPSKWLLELRTFLSSLNGSINIPSETHLRRYRLHDEFIMEHAMTLKFTNADLDHLNRIRLFLRITRLSDITSTDGTKLVIPKKRNPVPEDFRSRTTQLWPRQPNPGKPSWRVWKYYISLITKDGINLRTPLGKWWPQQYDRTWPVVYDPGTNHVFCYEHSCWVEYSYSDTNHGIKLDAYAISTRSHPPAIVIPVDEASRQGTQYTIPDFQSIEPQEQIPSTWHAYRKTLPLWESELIQHTTETFANQRLIHVFHQRDQTLYIVSDGGCDDARGIGSFGWVIADEHEILWEGWGKAYGSPMSSYRAEGYGRLAAIRFLIHYMKYLDIKSSDDLHIESATDNSSLLDKEAQWRLYTIPNPYRQLQPDTDIVQLINESWATVNASLNHAHVKGHQDDHTPVHLLPWKAQLNVRADQLATYALDTYNTQKRAEIALTDKPHLTLDGNWVTSKYPREIRRAAGKGSNNQNLRKIGITPKLNKSINWSAYTTARNRLQPSQQAFVTKVLYDWVNTNARTHRENSAIPAKCPHCVCTTETFDHVLKCPALHSWRVDFHLQLEEHLNKHATPKTLAEAITHDISHWLTGRHYDERRPETNLSIPLLLRGCIPKRWCLLLDEHYRRLEIRTHSTNGQTWTALLIQFFAQHLHHAWKIRSSLVTEQQNTAAEQKARTTAQQTVRDLYRLARKCTLKYPFHNPLELQLLQRTDHLQTWIANHSANIHRSHTRWKTRPRYRQSDIRTFFRRLPRQPVP